MARHKQQFAGYLASVSDVHINSLHRLISQIGISGVLIAAAQVCEEYAVSYTQDQDSAMSKVWWENNQIVTEASEQVNDATR